MEKLRPKDDFSGEPDDGDGFDEAEFVEHGVMVEETTC